MRANGAAPGGTEVLQDLWHAKQRLIKLFKKFHPDYHTAIAEFNKIMAPLRLEPGVDPFRGVLSRAHLALLRITIVLLSIAGFAEAGTGYANQAQFAEALAKFAARFREFSEVNRMSPRQQLIAASRKAAEAAGDAREEKLVFFSEEEAKEGMVLRGGRRAVAVADRDDLEEGKSAFSKAFRLAKRTYEESLSAADKAARERKEFDRSAREWGGVLRKGGVKQCKLLAEGTTGEALLNAYKFREPGVYAFLPLLSVAGVQLCGRALAWDQAPGYQY